MRAFASPLKRAAGILLAALFVSGATAAPPPVDTFFRKPASRRSRR